MIGRIRDRRTFIALRRRGRRAREGHLQVTTIAAGSPPRAAYSVSRRVGNAVTRNRLRRRLRAQLHELAAAGELASGAWLVNVDPPAAQQTSAELRRDLTAAIRRLQDAS